MGRHAIVASGGGVLIGTLADPDSIYAGQKIMSSELRQRVSRRKRQAQGEGTPQSDVGGVEYEIQLTHSYQDDDTGGMLMIPLAHYTTYKAGATTVFAGATGTVSATHKTGAHGEYIDQTITLESDGEPDVGALS